MSNVLHVPGDAVTARTADGTRSPTYPRLVLATTILASSLAFIDGSVVNVGLPAIGRSFHADATGLQWVVNAYLLPFPNSPVPECVWISLGYEDEIAGDSGYYAIGADGGAAGKE